MNHFRQSFPFLAVFLFLLAAGCTDRRSPEEMRDSLVYGFADPFKTFDPARQVYSQETAIMAQVLEPLVRWNNDLEMEPFLATSWETPDDCKTWIFYLREGVKFQDGTPFNAEAVKIHFERILDPKTASTRRKLIEDVVSIDAVDEHTVMFNLEAPNCIFPERLTSTFASIPSPTAMKKYGDDFSRHPAGTGPFQFKSWESDVAIRLEKYDEYWNAEEIKLEELIFRPVQENTTRLILLEQGVLDMADISFAHVSLAEETDDVVLQTAPQLSIRYIGFNTRKPPFDDKRVRQAANYAVNKKDIIEHVFFGVGEPARGPFPSVLKDFNPDIKNYDYDPEKARELLEEAGYSDGIEVTLWTQETGTYRVTADAVVEYLRNVGIDVEMKILDNAVYWDKFDEYLTPEGDMYPRKEGAYDIYVGGWVGGETAHGFLEPLFKEASYSNSSFYSNPEVNQLLKEYKNLPTAEERREAYYRMQEIIVEDAPWIFAFHGQANTGLRKRVKNFKVNNAGRYFFENVEVVDPEEVEDSDSLFAHSEDAE